MGHSPVNSYVVPIGGATPGYESEVVFSDGTFVEGSTAELSADGPLREPYVAFCQVRNPREVKFEGIFVLVRRAQAFSRVPHWRRVGTAMFSLNYPVGSILR